MFANYWKGKLQCCPKTPLAFLVPKDMLLTFFPIIFAIEIKGRQK